MRDGSFLSHTDGSLLAHVMETSAQTDLRRAAGAAAGAGNRRLTIDYERIPRSTAGIFTSMMKEHP
jgi:hypothetical protein